MNDKERLKKREERKKAFKKLSEEDKALIFRNREGGRKKPTKSNKPK
jgi:hypothetical protein